MSGSVGLPTIPTYLATIKNETAVALKSEKGDPTAEAAAVHFSASAAAIKTPAQLLKDYQSLTVVLGAFGMSSMIGETAILQKLMTQNPTSSSSLAQSSGNALWQRFAQQMSSWSSSSTPLSSTTAVSTIANQYLVSQYETNQDQLIPGMADALYFTRTAASIKSVDSLMSDPTLLNVTEVDLGLDPTQFGALDFDQQQEILKKQVALSSFSSTAGIQRMAEQFLALTQANPPAPQAPSGVASLFTSTDGGDDLMSIIGASLSASA